MTQKANSEKEDKALPVSGIRDNYRRGTAADFLRAKIAPDSYLSVVSAYFTIYAFDALKEDLSHIEHLDFLFGEPRFINALDPDRTEKKAFIIDTTGLHLANALEQKRVARECSDWIRAKVAIRSVRQANLLHGKMYHISHNGVEDALVGSSNFTVRGLGLGNTGNNIELNLEVDSNRDRRDLKAWFDEIWNDQALVEDVKGDVLSYLEQLYQNQAPEFIYYKTLFHIFEDFLADQAKGGLLDQNIKIIDTDVWKALFEFQRDGVKGAINKILKHNGCILADSVGLGKTFEALAVIKYFELKNERVLVLCPKKLRQNWTVYRNNDALNPFIRDRFRFDVLSHTDLSRETGLAGDIDLATFNWGNFDLVVIDESHNFRNNTPGRRDEEPELSGENNRPISPDNLRGLLDHPHRLKVWDPHKLDAKHRETSLAQEREMKAEPELPEDAFATSRLVAITSCWQFLFYNRRVDSSGLANFHRVFADLTKGRNLLALLKDKARLGAVAGAYRALAPSGNLNETSLAVFSGLYVSDEFRIVCHPYESYPFWPRGRTQQLGTRLGSVLTGDLTLNDHAVWCGMAQRFGLLTFPRQTMPLGYLVPHHGSRHNWGEYQAHLSNCEYVAASRAGSKKHPHKKVVNSLMASGHNLHTATEANSVQMLFAFSFNLSHKLSPWVQVQSEVSAVTPPDRLSKDSLVHCIHKSFSQQLARASKPLRALYDDLRSCIVNLGSDVVEHKTQAYGGFKRHRVFASILIHPSKRVIHVYMPIDPKTISLDPTFMRDVTSIGHNGIGDLEITLRSETDLEKAKSFLMQSYALS
jgi:predicted transport protein